MKSHSKGWEALDVSIKRHTNQNEWLKNKAFSSDEDARSFIKENMQWLNACAQSQRKHSNQSLDRQRNGSYLSDKVDDDKK